MHDDDLQNAVINHARADMESAPGMWQDAPERQAAMPSLGGQLKAMFREAVNDIRQTMNETFFGHHEHAPEVGTPMHPTPQMVTESLRGQNASYEAMKSMYAAQSMGRQQEHQLEME